MNTYMDKETIAVFLDIAAAFDTICPGLIKRKLLEHGGDPIMVNWYFKFITHRNLHVEINGNRVTKTVSIGFPQGGVCSAKFWIIAFNEAIEIINSYGAFGNGFADDCVTMISGKNLKAMMNNIQKVVNKLEAWGQTAGLKFNSSKTEVVIFTKKRLKPEHMPQKLRVSNQPVEFSPTAKYL